MTKPLPPCLDCGERRPRCHDPAACAAWAGYEAQQEAFQAANHPRWKEMHVVADYVRRKQSKLDRKEYYERNK